VSKNDKSLLRHDTSRQITILPNTETYAHNRPTALRDH